MIGMKVKIFIMLAAVSLLGFGVYKYGQNKYLAGYNAHAVEYNEVQQEALFKYGEELKRRYEVALERRAIEHEQALNLVEQLKNRKPEVIVNEITKYVEKTKCDNLGNDFVVLFNQIHSTTGVRDERESNYNPRE